MSASNGTSPCPRSRCRRPIYPRLAAFAALAGPAACHAPERSVANPSTAAAPSATIPADSAAETATQGEFDFDDYEADGLLFPGAPHARGVTGEAYEDAVRSRVAVRVIDGSLSRAKDSLADLRKGFRQCYRDMIPAQTDLRTGRVDTRHIGDAVVSVRVSVASNGFVSASRSEFSGDANWSLGECVERLVKTARFRAADTASSVEVTVRLSRP